MACPPGSSFVLLFSLLFVLPCGLFDLFDLFGSGPAYEVDWCGLWCTRAPGPRTRRPGL
ncbi:hypothetical protein OG788_26260 [Streptomyces sp. NBC_00647]|uniref:hypothetical protein n=1 Tax=Streptomyces sp. NBC_00647 TaxID=2975796 RepID=UPI0032523C52